MKGRLPLFVILGSSLTFLASLYLPWVGPTTDPIKRLLSSGQGGSGALSLLNLFSRSAYYRFPTDGWSSFGQAAAITAVALALCALVSLVQPEREALLPFGGCAIALLTLALVNAAQVRASRRIYPELHFHLDTGAYVGGAAALAALLSAAWVSHDDIPERGKAAAATLLTIGLVAAYALLGGGGSYGTAVMLLIASFGLTFWFGVTPPLRRLAAAAVILVLVVGGFSVLGTHTHWPYEAWLAIGCAIGLLVLAAASNRERPLVALGRSDAVALTGATLLLASLFFNWPGCVGSGPTRTCYVVNMWYGGLIGGLAGILVVLLVGFRYLSPELAVTIAIYVLGAGLSYGSLGYGAYVGFAGTALLLLALALQPRKAVRGGMRLIPVVACVALLALPAAILTGRMPVDIEMNGAWSLALLEAAAIALGLRLITRWLSGPAADDELLLLPVALLALVGLNLGEHMTWEGGLSLALSLLLLALGWIDRYGGGLDRLRIPDEIWRVDRISTGEN